MQNEILIPECWVDKELLLLLGFSKQIINKANGKADVLQKMKTAYNNQLAIGLVDLDKMKFPKHNDYNSFKEIEEFPKAFGMFLKKKINQPHFIIELEDEFEPWIISIAKPLRNKIPPPSEKYFDATFLHQKNATKNIDETTLNFYKKIIAANPAPFNQIKKWIEKISTNNI
jgi:hypothetical protein